MKNLLSILALSLFTTVGYSQNEKSHAAAMFCGKVGEGGPTGGHYTVKELQNCDWKIICVDTNFTVTEFRLSLVPKDDSFSYLEHQFTGNTIPESYRDQILNHARNVFIEYIKAKDKDGVSRIINAIAVRIQD